ncbi:type II toxin-antitoxin system VapC family toxin [Kovacikia minuta CCNUW1]|uniref:type II toxin-antitoxin system VapC family toxin n=1 Tax=Kovacikia minuta TaxID=2931930 RepID=UPI001CC943B6|nr:type II toxin-antitoxin system VapC family toxin [Kovacikia minuta]UBF24530.1 type II toxin-antitoxin system VapC family toxin [Kovacikia minuta CCNUW1]
MDKIVVDSSVVIKWFVVEPYSVEACQLLNHYQSGGLTLLAPDLIYSEVGNIVWKKQQFQGLAATDAQQVIDCFRSLNLVLTPTATLLDAAYSLAVTYNVYDAMYLALSQREQCPFITADEKLVNAVSPNFPGVVWVANVSSVMP